MQLNKINFDLNSIDQQFINDPFPLLAELTRHSPVHYNLDGSVFLTRYHDVRHVYRSPDVSSDKQQAYGDKFGQCPLYTHHTTSLIFNDPPYHTIVRKLLAAAFTPRKLSEMAPLIEGIVDKLLDRLEDLKQFDLIDEFAKQLPTEIISFMLGIPHEHREKLRGFSLAILGALDPVVPQERLDAGNAAVEEFGDLLINIIGERRAQKSDAGAGDVLDALIFGEIDGRRLTDKELVQNCIFLLNAGHETTTSLLGNSVSVLLDFPDQHKALLENPELITPAVEEFLRFQSPLQIGNRQATADITLPSGGIIKEGTYIHTSIGAANRDPSVFANPDQVDISRNPNRHIAFITGIHVCLGATLARIEGRIAIGRLVRRFPKLAAAGPAEMVPLARFRGCNRLPVSV